MRDYFNSLKHCWIGDIATAMELLIVSGCGQRRTKIEHAFRLLIVFDRCRAATCISFRAQDSSVVCGSVLESFIRGGPEKTFTRFLKLSFLR